MKTPEQKAIEKYKNLPAIVQGSGCACIGPQYIKGFIRKEEPYSIELKNNEQRTKYIIQVHKFFNISLAQAKEKVDNNKVQFEEKVYCQWFYEELQKVGIDAQIIEKPTGLYPDCECRMRNVIEVDGKFYKVKETVSSEEVTCKELTYNVHLLGPVGGPYNNII